MGKTKIKIDYSKCGPEGSVDPRDCAKCLNVCDPCVFLRHEDLKYKEDNIRGICNKYRSNSSKDIGP